MPACTCGYRRAKLAHRSPPPSHSSRRRSRLLRTGFLAGEHAVAVLPAARFREAGKRAALGSDFGELGAVGETRRAGPARRRPASASRENGLSSYSRSARSRGEYGCGWATCAKRTDAPVVAWIYADHSHGTRRVESLRPFSGPSTSLRTALSSAEARLTRRAPRSKGRRSCRTATAWLKLSAIGSNLRHGE